MDGVLTVDDGRTPWHNAANPFDVNGDGLVTAVDALALVNQLNALVAGSSSAADATVPMGYYDVNDDSFCTALDALQVIDVLNRSSMAEAEGEGARLGSGTIAAPGDRALEPRASVPGLGNDFRFRENWTRAVDRVLGEAAASGTRVGVSRPATAATHDLVNRQAATERPAVCRLSRTVS